MSLLRPALVLLAAIPVFGGSWEDVQRIAPDQKIEVKTKDGAREKATFVSASGETLVMREANGERSVAKAEIAEVRVHDAARKVRHGLIWTAVGAAAGAAIGFAVCPGCANEGHGYKYVGPGIAAGAGVGALGFLTASYRTVYKSAED